MFFIILVFNIRIANGNEQKQANCELIVTKSEQVAKFWQ